MNKIKGFFGAIGKFLSGVNAELKKVTWPARKQVANNTSIVIVCIILIGIAIWVLDLVFGLGLAKFFSDVQGDAGAAVQ